MTQLSENEPPHWHGRDARGAVRHVMADPRNFPSYLRAHWSDDERAYVEHLEAHERLKSSQEPLDTDHKVVATYLNYLAGEEKLIAKIRELVLALREELAGGVPIEQAVAMQSLSQLHADGLWPGRPAPAPETTTKAAT